MLSMAVAAIFIYLLLCYCMQLMRRHVSLRTVQRFATVEHVQQRGGQPAQHAQQRYAYEQAEVPGTIPLGIQLTADRLLKRLL